LIIIDPVVSFKKQNEKYYNRIDFIDAVKRFWGIGYFE